MGVHTICHVDVHRVRNDEGLTGITVDVDDKVCRSRADANRRRKKRPCELVTWPDFVPPPAVFMSAPAVSGRYLTSPQQL
jgi:hypothetical protein